VSPHWIFGYGSLVWRPAFPFLERRAARLDGMMRRFWQGSTDHRGVPEAPGRVVTLLEAPESHVWGRAFRVSEDVHHEVLERLDHREQGGYERSVRPVALKEPAADGRDEVEALVYVATPGNPNFLGPAPEDAIVAQILESRGPSGPNDEYLLRLDEALREIGVEDPHVGVLAQRVRAAQSRR
jgi:cation transport protein ChaC